LLTEENFDAHVRRGFVNYIPEDLIMRLEMKTHVKRVLGHVRTIIGKEILPPIRVAQQKCTGAHGYETSMQTVVA